MGHATVGPRELQLRQLAQATRAAKNERAANKAAKISSPKDAMAKTTEAMVKPKAKGKKAAKKKKRRA